jgi:hypothetical protein
MLTVVWFGVNKIITQRLLRTLLNQLNLILIIGKPTYVEVMLVWQVENLMLHKLIIKKYHNLNNLKLVK